MATFNFLTARRPRRSVALFLTDERGSVSVRSNRPFKKNDHAHIFSSSSIDSYSVNTCLANGSHPREIITCAIVPGSELETRVTKLLASINIKHYS